MADDGSVSESYTYVKSCLAQLLSSNIILGKFYVKHESVGERLLRAVYISKVRTESPPLMATSALNTGIKGPAIRLFCLKDDHHVCSQIKT